MTVTNKSTHEFPSLLEAPGLEQRDEVLGKIRTEIPVIQRSASQVDAEREAIIDETSLQRALKEAYKAGATAMVSTVQLVLDDLDQGVDITRFAVFADIAADMDLLPERQHTE